MDPRRVRSFDGTEIVYHVTEAPFAGAPCVVLANGLGGTWRAWRGLIDYFRDRCRFMTWDYRGLHASQRPWPDVAGAYTVESHALDLQAVLTAERIERASLVGWSMGVPVALDASRRRRGLAANLVLINGTFGRPQKTRALLLALTRRAHRLASRVTRAALARPGAGPWLKRLGLVSQTLDDAVLAELASDLGRLDLEAYLRNVAAIGRHDASASIASVDVPALIIAGDADRLTPPSITTELARRIPGAETLVVRGGTHCTPIEYPELVALRIERFWRERGFC